MLEVNFLENVEKSDEVLLRDEFMNRFKYYLLVM